MSRANIKETAEKGLLLGCSSSTGHGSSSMHAHDDDGWPQPTTVASVARDMMCTCSMAVAVCTPMTMMDGHSQQQWQVWQGT